jgi:CHAD domain-containing protein
VKKGEHPAKSGQQAIVRTPMAAGEKTTRLTLPGELHELEALAEPVGSSLFTTVHHDTPGHALAGAGVSLRRRLENGESTWCLTLPRGQSLELPGGPAKPPARIRALLVALVRDLPLEPVATFRTRRSTLRVREEGADAADILADSVALMEGRRVATSFSEIEVAPLNGERAAVRRVVRRLIDQGARRDERRPALLRALGLVPDAPPKADRKSAPPLESLGALLAAQLRAVQSHDPGVRLGTDPEDLHRVRVAVRRARAILRGARPLLDEQWADSLRAELGWLGQALGPVRDLDVLLAHLRDEIGTLDADEAFAAERLVHTLESERYVARAALLEALDSNRYLALLDALGEAADQPRPSGRSVGLAELARLAFADLRETAKGLGPRPSDEELHRLRIKTKRARYVGELAAGTVGKRAERFVTRARVLQDLVGTHQDAVVASARLRELSGETGGDRVAFAAGRLLEREEARRREARSAVPKAWQKLQKAGRRAWA